MKLITRGQWGARAPRSITALRHPTSVTDHWEGPSIGIPGHDKCYSLVRGIQTYHMDTMKWNDLAYNAIVCPHGYTFEGRWLGVRSAANGTNAGNESSYAVCGLRGEGDPFSDAMKTAFREVHAFFKQAIVHPHRKWIATSCPGPDQVAWITAGCPAPALNAVVSDDPIPTTQACGLTVYQDGSQYTFARDGGVFATGGANFFGSLASVRLNAPVVAGFGLPDKSGYYMIGEDGGIFAFGSARPIQPYDSLFDEYARGERKITAGQIHEAGLILLSNLGETYFLA